MKQGMAVLVLLALCSCQRSPSEVVDKVLVDFGMREKPEGYVQGSDKVDDRFAAVGKTELKRLNAQGRNGEIKFQEEQGLQGKYFKEVKVYENSFPTGAQAMAKTGSDSDRGYVGYIDYSYRLYQSERRNTRAEAAALDANIRTEETGRETYRYTFTPAGTWDGGEGKPVKRP